MDLTTEQIERIKELAGLLLSISEIAIDLSLPVEAFKFEYSNENSELFSIYNKAVIETKIKLRKPVIDMAAMGGPHAQALANSYLTNQEIEND